MPRTRHYTQQALIAAPIDEVWAWLADPLRHVELHPLMRTLTILDEDAGPGDESAVEFEVVDGLRMMGLEMPLRYRSRMRRRPSQWSLSTEARCWPRLTTVVDWRFAPVADEAGRAPHTRIHEQVSMTAPAAIVGYAMRQSQRSHQRLFEALERRILATTS
ncbi:MAG: hypothetical protein Tsb0020_39750 [Haliangiales bacterium]